MKKLFLSAVILASVFSFVSAPVILSAEGGANLGEEGGRNPGEESGRNPGEEGGTNRPAGVAIKIENPFKIGDSLYALVEAIVNNIVLPIGGVLCVLAFIYAGFKYVTARGDETKIKDASKALLWTAVGTAILLGAWVFANVIRETINQII